MRLHAMFGLITTLLLIGAPPAFATTNTLVGGYLDTPRGRLYYEREGSGPPIVLLAGGPGESQFLFHPWFSRLAAHNTVIYLDNIGRGKSSRLGLSGSYTIAGDVADVENLRKALGFAKIALLGHSAGGMVAAGYAAAHPDRVSALILSSAVISADEWNEANAAMSRVLQERDPIRWSQITSLRAAGVPPSSMQMMQLYLAPQLYWYDPRNAAKLPSFSPEDDNQQVLLDEIGPDPFGVVTGTAAGFNPVSGLRRLRIPVLICAGDADVAVVPSIASETAASFQPGVASVVHFPRSGHRPFIEEPDSYFHALSAFLNRK